MSNHNINQFKLYSWNVLHIIHELNYAYDCSFVLENWLNKENNRLDRMARIIVKYASHPKAVVCLQECPGDLLNMINNMNIFGDFSVYSYKYGRDPKLKNHIATNPYSECTEYLVTLIGKHNLVNSTNIVQFEDPGKASLIVNINVVGKLVSIANIHCPFGTSRNVAFQQLISELNGNEYIIIGDLNSEQWELEKIFDRKIYKFSNITKPTRIAKSIRKIRKGDEIVIRETTLDHMIGTTSTTFNQTFVEPNNNLSDHLLIGATVQLS